MNLVAKEPEAWKMVYSIDEDQLLRLWSVICCFENMRETQDPILQSVIITNAQIFLTAFVLDLKPLLGGQTGSATLRTGPGQATKFDA